MITSHYLLEQQQRHAATRRSARVCTCLFNYRSAAEAVAALLSAQPVVTERVGCPRELHFV